MLDSWLNVISEVAILFNKNFFILALLLRVCHFSDSRYHPFSLELDTIFELNCLLFTLQSVDLFLSVVVC